MADGSTPFPGLGQKSDGLYGSNIFNDMHCSAKTELSACG